MNNTGKIRFLTIAYSRKKNIKNLVVSQKTLIFACKIKIKIKNYGKNHR